MVGARSMLRATIERIVGLADLTDPLVICNVDHHHLVKRELADAGYDPTRVVLEPMGRNTAPAVAAAALVVAEIEGPDALMLVLPADHVIAQEQAFRSTIGSAIASAETGSLVTFGIAPTRPETGYGYIRVGEEVAPAGHRIKSFVEKPDAATAAAYLENGRYLWNSGMFLLSAAAFLGELRRYRPEILAAVEAAVVSALRGDAIRLDGASFAASPSDSIDYAVMEHTTQGIVFRLDAGWNDVGSWSALHDVSARDTAGNTIIGDVTAIDTTDSYIRSDDRLVTTIGLDRIFVVDTPDAVIVAPLDRSQAVKQIVDDLKARHRREATASAAGDESWGSWSILNSPNKAMVRDVRIDPAATARLAGEQRIVVVHGSITVSGANDDSSYTTGDILTASDPMVTNVGSVAAILVAVEVGAED